MDVPVGEVEAGDDGRDAARREGRNDRQRPARADEQRAGAEDALERFGGERDRRRVRLEAAGIAAGEQRHLDVGAGRRALAEQLLRGRRDPLQPLSGSEPHRHHRLRRRGDDRLHQLRGARGERMHVDRRLRPRAQVELTGGVLVRRSRALGGEQRFARLERAPRGELRLRRRLDSFA